MQSLVLHFHILGQLRLLVGWLLFVLGSMVVGKRMGMASLEYTSFKEN
jgi:hypothetical protein